MNNAPCRVKAKQKPEPGVSKKGAGLSVVVLSEGGGAGRGGRGGTSAACRQKCATAGQTPDAGGEAEEKTDGE